MFEKQVCRGCQIASIVGSNSSSGGRKAFALKGSTPHYAPDRPFRLEHIILDLAIEPKAKLLRGKVTQRVQVVAPAQKILKLDQIGLEIEEVKLDTRPIGFFIDEEIA